MRALLLNANGEPLHVCDARRALLLILEEVADVIVESNVIVHSQYLEFKLPSVVRLRRYINIPRGRSIPLTTRTVIARDRGLCGYCGDEATTMDHIIPRSKGGPHTWENVIAACRPCNHRKRDRTPAQAKMELLHQPHRPKGAHAKLLLFSVDPAWESFLFEK